MYVLPKITFWIVAFLSIPFLVHTEDLTFSYQKGNFIYFEGQGKANPQHENATQRRSLSKEAAILSGKAKITFYIDSLKTKNNIPIKETLLKDGKIKLKVSSFLKGIQVAESSWDNQDNCKVLLKINKKALLQKLKAKE